MSQPPSPTASPSPSPRTNGPGPKRRSISFQTNARPENFASISTTPSISVSGNVLPNRTGRTSFIQFAPALETISTAAEASEQALKKASRLPSPPPPSTYERRVCFDTFKNKDATDLSFTLISKHKDYTYKRGQRVFLVGTDQNDYSEFALEWLVEELVEDGDEIVCLRVVDKDSKIAGDTALQENEYKQEANALLDHIQDKSEKGDGKAISLILEFAVGKVEETIERMINLYAPASLIVGTRGRSLGGIQGLLPGSVSKYCLQNSPVPVIVVRPQHKRMKKMQKRQANNPKQGYNTVLNQSIEGGSGAFDTLTGYPIIEASKHEAEAVAKAIGLPGTFGNWRDTKKEGSAGGDIESNNLARVSSSWNEAESDPETPNLKAPLVVEADGIETMLNYVSDTGDTNVDDDREGGEQETQYEAAIAVSLDGLSSKDANIANDSDNMKSKDKTKQA